MKKKIKISGGKCMQPNSKSNDKERFVKEIARKYKEYNNQEQNFDYYEEDIDFEHWHDEYWN